MKFILYAQQLINLDHISRIKADLNKGDLRFHDGTESFGLNILSHPAVKKLTGGSEAEGRAVLGYLTRVLAQFIASDEGNFLDLWETVSGIEKAAKEPIQNTENTNGQSGDIRGSEGGTEAGDSGSQPSSGNEPVSA